MVQEARDASTIVGLVAAGAGIALVPGDTRCVQLQGAVYQPVKDKGAVSSLWLVRRVSDPSPFTALMIGILRAERRRAVTPQQRGARGIRG